MALTILLICLAVQHFTHFDSYTEKYKRYQWFDVYYEWLKARFSQIAVWSGLMRVLMAVLPALILYILVATIVYHVFTIVGYYLLTLVVVWYCLDARPLTAESVKGVSARQILADRYQQIFAVIFWLLLLGSTGVVLYTLVSSLRRLLEKQQGDAKEQLLKAVIATEGVLDWLPLRLMGISYALVGQFAPTFKLWLQNLLTGFNHTREQAAECGTVALGLTDPDQSVSDEHRVVIANLINRTLLLWLVVIALFTIGRWIG